MLGGTFMLRFIKSFIRILLFPVIVILNIMIALGNVILSLFSGITGFLFLVSLLCVVVAITNSNYQYMLGSALLSAVVLSPIGIPLVGTLFITTIEMFKDWLKVI